MKTKTTGFSLVELLVVFAIMAVIATFAIVGIRDYARFQQYDATVATVKSTFAAASSKARAAELDQAYGVKVLPTSLVVFYGSIYNGAAATNETIDTNGVIIYTDLAGGTDEIVFNKLSGLPNATGTIDIVGLEHVATTTLTITAAGVIQ
jgi:prepilin-type N-terminal cleavage/methylation domain-containing protein